MLILIDTIFHWLGKGKFFKIYKMTQEMCIKYFVCVCVCVCVCVLSRFSHVQLFATLWTVAHQVPLYSGIL